MSFWDNVSWTRAWTKEQEASKKDVVRQIQKNCAVSKWHRTARQVGISFPKYVTGAKPSTGEARGYKVWLPEDRTWKEKNMKWISHVAVLQYEKHTCVAFLLGTTWFTFGLGMHQRRKEKVRPGYKPLVPPEMMKTLRRLIPSLTRYLKETTAVNYTMPDAMVGDHFLRNVEVVDDACPEDYKQYRSNLLSGGSGTSYYEWFEHNFPSSGDDDVELLWVGLCPETTKTVLASIDFKFDPWEKEVDDVMGDFHRLRRLTVDWRNSGKMNMREGYSVASNNCVALAESLSGMPCNAFGMFRTHEMCRFDPKKHPINMSFLDKIISIDSTERPLEVRIADWIVANLTDKSEVENALPKQRILFCLATMQSHPVFFVGTCCTGEGPFRWVPIFLGIRDSKKVFITRKVVISNATVRNIKVLNVTDVTDWRLVVQAMFDNTFEERDTDKLVSTKFSSLQHVVSNHGEFAKEFQTVGFWENNIFDKTNFKDFISDLHIPQ